MRFRLQLALLSSLSLTVPGCSMEADSAAKPATPRAILITVTQAQQRDVEVVEHTVGNVESTINPTVTAEVAGRVTRVIARAGDRVQRGDLLAEIYRDDLKLSRQGAAAEVGRIEALLQNQRTVVERNRRLVESKFISQNVLDESASQLRALEEQLAAAKSQLALNDSSLAKTRVAAPIDAQIDRPIVSGGDYVKVGDPMFALISTKAMNVYLPFPEHIAPRLRVGLPVRISSPAVDAEPVQAQIAEIKPALGTANRAVNAIVRMRGVSQWKPGASVTASVILDVRRQAVVVPESSVVLRPAGKVVYVIEQDKAMQRVVDTGYKQDGVIEVTAGLKPGETVALDGAGFLTDGAAVTIQPGSS